MSNKAVKTRIQSKHGLEKDWLRATNFKPLSGEMIIYDPQVTDEQRTLEDGTLLPVVKTPRFKVGNGTDVVSDLPFASVIREGGAEGAAHHIADGNGITVDLTGKNANASALKPELNGVLPYGATGKYAVSLGGKSVARGKRALAEGTSTVADGDYSHAEGMNTVTLGAGAHSEGGSTTASEEHAHAEGTMTQALKKGAHAEGGQTIADGQYAHAEGANTKATNYTAHAEGYNTTASGSSAHAEGEGTLANYKASHAGGYYTRTDKIGQTAIGTYNAIDDHALLIVGNGSDEANRSNAFVVKDDGAAFVGKNPTTDMGVATKGYVDSLDRLKNMTDGRANGSAQLVPDGDMIYFTDRNPNAIQIDSSLNGSIPSGASGEYSVSLGRASAAIGTYAVAEGLLTIAKGNESHAEGSRTVTLASGAHAEGGTTTAAGQFSHAEGYNTQALAKGAHAEGGSTEASGMYSHAEGDSTKATNYLAHAEGYSTEASGPYAHAEGYDTLASGNTSHTEGVNTAAYGKASHAEGERTTASGYSSHAEGEGLVLTELIPDISKMDARITGINTDNSTILIQNLDLISAIATSNIGEFFIIALDVIENNNIIRTINVPVDAVSMADDGSGVWLHVVLNGFDQALVTDIITKIMISNDSSYVKITNLYQGIANGDYSHVEGKHSVAAGAASHASGEKTIATGIGATAKGFKTNASGDYSSAEGLWTVASGLHSHSEGNHTKAVGGNAHAEGYETEANKDNAHAEGIRTIAAAQGAHAEGEDNKVYSRFGHVEGWGNIVGDVNNPDAYGNESGQCSHAEGASNTVTGNSAHAEGESNTASGLASHAEGSNTIAASKHQHVQGAYNVVDEDNKYAHIVGNGSDEDSRHNAHTLDWDGNAWFAGSVYSNDDKLATQTELDNVCDVADKALQIADASLDRVEAIENYVSEYEDAFENIEMFDVPQDTIELPVNATKLNIVGIGGSGCVEHPIVDNTGYEDYVPVFIKSIVSDTGKVLFGLPSNISKIAPNLGVAGNLIAYDSGRWFYLEAYIRLEYHEYYLNTSSYSDIGKLLHSYYDYAVLIERHEPLLVDITDQLNISPYVDVSGVKSITLVPSYKSYECEFIPTFIASVDYRKQIDPEGNLHELLDSKIDTVRTEVTAVENNCLNIERYLGITKSEESIEFTDNIDVSSLISPSIYRVHTSYATYTYNDAGYENAYPVYPVEFVDDKGSTVLTIPQRVQDLMSEAGHIHNYLEFNSNGEVVFVRNIDYISYLINPDDFDSEIYSGQDGYIYDGVRFGRRHTPVRIDVTMSFDQSQLEAFYKAKNLKVVMNATQEYVYDNIAVDPYGDDMHKTVNYDTPVTEYKYTNYIETEDFCLHKVYDTVTTLVEKVSTIESKLDELLSKTTWKSF